MRFLLDTNVFSELTKAEPNRRVLSGFQQHRFTLVTCAPVLHELEYGIARLKVGKRREVLREFVDGLLSDGIEILPYGRSAAEIHARARAAMESRGIPRPYVDGQVAAIAVANDCALVTRNAADFKGFPELRLSNWFKA